jgi:hypothetical protein
VPLLGGMGHRAGGFGSLRPPGALTTCPAAAYTAHAREESNRMATKARKSWWSEPVSWEEVCRRNRGRQKLNAWRRYIARERRKRVLELLIAFDWKYGAQRLIAEELAVSESTISRDVAALGLIPTCRTCGGLRLRGRYAAALRDPEAPRDDHDTHGRRR